MVRSGPAAPVDYYRRSRWNAAPRTSAPLTPWATVGWPDGCCTMCVIFNRRTALRRNGLGRRRSGPEGRRRTPYGGRRPSVLAQWSPTGLKKNHIGAFLVSSLRTGLKKVVFGPTEGGTLDNSLHFY
jgi:hypothetical protein